MIVRCLLPALLLAAATSCRRAAENARAKIRIESVEGFDLADPAGAELVLRVANGTRHKLRLDRVRLDLYFAGSRACGIQLREAVEVPRRATVDVRTRWQMRIADPLAAYALYRRVRQGDLSQVTVSCVVEGRGGPVGVNISREKMPISEFLNIFGVTAQEAAAFLNPKP